MEGAVAYVAKQEAVPVVLLPTVLAPLAPRTLPASPDHRRDTHMSASIEIVLPALCAEEQVHEVLRLQRCHPTFQPLAVVVQVRGVAINCSKKSNENVTVPINAWDFARLLPKLATFPRLSGPMRVNVDFCMKAPDAAPQGK